MLGLCRLRHNCLMERHCVYCTFHQKLTKNSIKMERKKKKETTNGSVDVSGLPVGLRSQFVECQHHPSCRKECFCEFSFCFPFMFVFLGACLPLIPPTWFLHRRMKLNRDCQSSCHRIQKVHRFVIFCSECLFSTSLIFRRLLSCEIVFHSPPPHYSFFCVWSDASSL